MRSKKAKQQTKFVVCKALGKATNEDADEQGESTIQERVTRIERVLEPIFRNYKQLSNTNFNAP